MIPLADVVRRSMAVPEMTSQIVSAMAAVALTLAGLGVFGVVAFAVRSRDWELAMRMALGASSARLKRELVAGLAPVLTLSLLVGVASASLAALSLRALVYGVSPADPLSFASAIATVAGISLLAALLRARRVSRVDPARVLGP